LNLQIQLSQSIKADILQPHFKELKGNLFPYSIL